MKNVLLLFQIILSLAVVGLILIQAKGTGLGRAFGSQAYHSKRGVENLVFRSTIVLSVLFVIVSVVSQLFI
ncbi:MAG: Protein translocase, SecG subunit [Candidatus Amesbacteria bacterium GW2011_GWB1_47_19]|nr:MAG: Protein translocase, SecG subunit [Candidatus Amesbacteria bacterium GW2011_GWA1_44_24]KKU31150.1 MAG: Protein translocase, SecG subunit [Candidatus Amesbacteria bacterium GW2011_GWC1_46_24]KKU67271.1 MAG: Protein translocase, SecG subunit [Candidatus Amesbacteria bacterium GW2011_GWB1_47_19]OGD05831.1 MAG: preprotein translocase subunit SecG [Candidatus Amesbacteria bacterium RIFOXYB1_FULL_47_13]HBC72693.1 preprotein translocase subunit SecG [Candidatus Amesbacteria bacterium]